MISVIYLAGYMTSGKSTIGPILANVLGWDFYDLDRVIEGKEKMTVVDIFDSKGEDYFRKLETDQLLKLSKIKNVIISLGGGTLTKKKNYSILKSTGKIIYLKTTPEVIYKRIKNKIDRPIFRDLVLSENSEEDFLKKINTHLNERSKYYERADITINTDETRIGLTVDLLAKKIRRMIHEDN